MQQPTGRTALYAGLTASFQDIFIGKNQTMAKEKKTYPGEGDISIKINTDGKEIDCSQFLVSVTTKCEFNRIASAEIILEDGGLTDEDFTIGNSDTFLIGKDIEIAAGFGDSTETIFSGTIVKQSIKIDNKKDQLLITAKHKAFKMTMNRQFRSFEDQTDTDIIKSICGEYGIDCEADTTEVKHEKLIQYNCTDWDFINMRAEANGLLLFTSLEGISMKAPDFGAEPVIEISNGYTIIDMQVEMDGRNAFDTYDAKAWNYTAQAPDEDSANGGESDSGQGDIDTKKLASQMDNGSFSLGRMTSQENPDAMSAVTKAIAMRNDLARIVGKITVLGYAPVNPSDLVTLKQIGKRFDGVAFVSSVTQNLSNGSWKTTLGIGFDNIPFADKFTDINTKPADGLLPCANGLQIAKVEGLEGDPLGEERIYIKLLGSDDTKLWARVATLDAGNGRGSAFMPEIGDEVIVGFINDDPTQAVVLGMMHSSSAPSPYEKSDDNNLKGFVSREKIKLEFDDEKKALTIVTPGGNKLCISDDAKGISLTDQNGNIVTLDDNGITIESKKALNIKAAQDLSIEGMNVSGKANSQLKWEGTASAEVSASGNTVIKGGIVQIN